MFPLDKINKDISQLQNRKQSYTWKLKNNEFLLRWKKDIHFYLAEKNYNLGNLQLCITHEMAVLISWLPKMETAEKTSLLHAQFLGQWRAKRWFSTTGVFPCIPLTPIGQQQLASRWLLVSLNWLVSQKCLCHSISLLSITRFKG